jgi:hypothetical protein
MTCIFYHRSLGVLRSQVHQAEQGVGVLGDDRRLLQVGQKNEEKLGSFHTGFDQPIL